MADGVYKNVVVEDEMSRKSSENKADSKGIFPNHKDKLSCYIQPLWPIPCCT